MRIARRVSGIFFSVLASALLLATGASAQERDEYGNPIAASTAPDPGADDIRQTVARISAIDGEVSYARGDAPDDWQAADRNVPVTLGDRLYTGAQGRAELQVHGGSIVRIGSDTDFAVLNMTDDTKQFAVKSGVASIFLDRLEGDDVFELDTPNTAITLEKAGDYRVDIDADGNTRVIVRQGQASVAAGGGSVPLSGGDALRVWGTDNPQYASVSIDESDGWDRWVGERQARIEHSASRQYVSRDVSGVSDLDEYGRWQEIPTYGRVWAPTVAVGWEPYRVGRWIWQDPWGWTWVSTEPWGWAPYHYGRWVFYTSRWCWVPVAGPVRVVTYSPALVAFVGGGPGWSASFTAGGSGYVGWFPLAPRDPFVHWWGPRAQVNVTNVTYVNRTYVTVVNRNTFVSAGVVSTNIVRDRYVVREVSSAPVLRGPLPIAPTRASIQIASARGVAVIRPPAAVVSRSVVARVAPPPAPPSFDRKLTVIRENRGAPVTAAVAAQVAVQDRRPQAVTGIRPVSTASGSVTLQQRTTSTATGTRALRVEPVAPARGGRAMATIQQPVAAAPVVAPRPARPVGENVPARVAPPTPPPAAGGGRPARVEPSQPPSSNPPPTRNRMRAPATYAPRPTAAPYVRPAVVPTPRAVPEQSRERVESPKPRPTPVPQMEHREPPRSEKPAGKPTARPQETHGRGPRVSPTPKHTG